MVLLPDFGDFFHTKIAYRGGKIEAVHRLMCLKARKKAGGEIITNVDDISPNPTAQKERIDYSALQQTYARMFAENPFSNQTELSLHLRVRRA